MQLKKEALSGMIWVFVDYFLVKGISFIGSIYLARILEPSDFGLIAMIAIFITLGNIILDSGLSSSLIRNHTNDDSDYSTVFYTNIFFGIVLYLCLYFVAPLIALFFRQEILIEIIRVYTLIFILSSFASVQLAILIKSLSFKTIAVLNVPGVFIGLLVGILMALNGYGVWSIIAMYLVTKGVLVLALWIKSDWRPKLLFSKKKFIYHINFGYKLLLANFLSGTTTNIYNAVIGRFYSLNITGNFERAFTLNNYPLIILTQIIGKVSFPLLSKIQNDKDYLRRVFIKLTKFAFFISAPIMLILSASAKPFILTILGDKWSESIPIFQILCFSGLFYTLQALNVNTIKIYGKTDYILKGEIFLKLFMVISSGLGLYLGFETFLWSIVLNSLITLIVNMYFCSKVIDVSILNQFRGLQRIFIISIFTYLSLYLFIQFIDSNLDINNFLQLIIYFLFGGIVYIAYAYLFKIKILNEIYKLIKP